MEIEAGGRAVWLYVAEDASAATADRLIDALVERFELLVEHDSPRK